MLGGDALAAGHARVYLKILGAQMLTFKPLALYT